MGMLDRGGPLAGVRVVDIGDGSGRMAAKLLAELGAHVVRVHRGDSGPAMVDAPGGVLDWWFDGGTDLAAGIDDERLAQLIAAADILLESGAPLERTWDNPRLTHVILTPFGLDGPRAGWRGSDLVMAAAGGILSVTGTPEEPVTIWGRQMDNLAGAYAAISALTGLYRARSTGHGTTFDLAHQHCVMSCSEHVLMFWWWPKAFEAIGGPIAQRQLALHWSRIYDVVPCKRGFCMVSPSAGGVPDLLAWMAERGHVPAPVDMTDIRALGNSLMGALRAFCIELDATDVFDGGQQRHVPFGEVLTIAQVSESPQHTARGFFRPVTDTRVDIPGPFARFSETPAPEPLPPPEEPLTDAALDDLIASWSAIDPSPTTGDPAAAPLAGVRVIDFTHVLAGPFATRVLADLGAEVIKVQTEIRAQAASHNSYPYFAMWNRSKKSIVLNMTDPRALDVLRRLVEVSDVVTENFSAGVLDEWGAGWPALSSWNPRVSYLSMHGAGEDGPWRDFVTFAPTVHALAGLTAISGPEGRIECGPGVALNDHLSGLAGALAVLAALESRGRTGRGQHIDLSQLELASYLIGPAFVDHRSNGREALAAGTRDAFTDPVPNDVVMCADGAWLAVTAGDDADWSSLAAVIAAPAGLESVDDRRARRAEVHDLLAAWAIRRPAADAADVLQAAGVPAAKVQDAAHLTGEDPQLRHRGAFLELPSELFGIQHVERFPAHLTDASGAPIELTYRATPYYGEHTFALYGELLGMDEIEVAEHIGDGLFT